MVLSRYLWFFPGQMSTLLMTFSDFCFPDGRIKVQNITLNHHFGMKHFSFWNVSLKHVKFIFKRFKTRNVLFTTSNHFVLIKNVSVLCPGSSLEESVSLSRGPEQIEILSIVENWRFLLSEVWVCPVHCWNSALPMEWTVGARLAQGRDTPGTCCWSWQHSPTSVSSPLVFVASC